MNKETEKKMEKGKWVNAKQYAEANGLPVDTIRQYCRAGRIRHFKIGQRYMFDPKDMDEFLEQQANDGLHYTPGTYREALKARRDRIQAPIGNAPQKEEVGT